MGHLRRHLQVLQEELQELPGADERAQARQEAAGGAQGYSRRCPWGRGHRWDPGVRRDRGHRGSRERQRCQERPARGTGGREEAAQPFLPRPGGDTRDTHGSALGTRLAVSTGVALRREGGRGGSRRGWQDARPKDREPSDVTYSRTGSASRAGGTGLTAGTLGTFAATSSLGTGLTLGRKRRRRKSRERQG